MDRGPSPQNRYETPYASGGAYGTAHAPGTAARKVETRGYAPVDPFKASLALGVKKWFGKRKDRTIDEIPVGDVSGRAPVPTSSLPPGFPPFPNSVQPQRQAYASQNPYAPHSQAHQPSQVPISESWFQQRPPATGSEWPLPEPSQYESAPNPPPPLNDDWYTGPATKRKKWKKGKKSKRRHPQSPGEELPPLLVDPSTTPWQNWKDGRNHGSASLRSRYDWANEEVRATSSLAPSRSDSHYQPPIPPEREAPAGWETEGETRWSGRDRYDPDFERESRSENREGRSTERSDSRFYRHLATPPVMLPPEPTTIPSTVSQPGPAPRPWGGRPSLTSPVYQEPILAMPHPSTPRLGVFPVMAMPQPQGQTHPSASSPQSVAFHPPRTRRTESDSHSLSPRRSSGSSHPHPPTVPAHPPSIHTPPPVISMPRQSPPASLFSFSAPVHSERSPSPPTPHTPPQIIPIPPGRHWHEEWAVILRPTTEHASTGVAPVSIAEPLPPPPIVPRIAMPQPYFSQSRESLGYLGPPVVPPIVPSASSASSRTDSPLGYDHPFPIPPSPPLARPGWRRVRVAQATSKPPEPQYEQTGWGAPILSEGSRPLPSRSTEDLWAEEYGPSAETRPPALPKQEAPPVPTFLDWDESTSHQEIATSLILQATWYTIVATLFLDIIPQQVYLHLLLRFPSLYFSRVTRIFQDANLGMGEIKRMALEAVELDKEEGLNRMLLNHGIFPQDWHGDEGKTSASYMNLRHSWQGFIDSLMREWKTLNIISVLLLSAILTILQIESAAANPLTRFSALLSLVCAFMSLIYGCLYIIRFGTMRKTHKAAEWANESEQSSTSIFWNVWVMLAMPAVWLGWSMIFYIICIMSFIWQTGTVVVEQREFLPTDLDVLIPRIVITCVLGLGVVYLLLVGVTFRRYSDPMEQAWQERIEGWLEEKAQAAAGFYRPPGQKGKAANEGYEKQEAQYAPFPDNFIPAAPPEVKPPAPAPPPAPTPPPVPTKPQEKSTSRGKKKKGGHSRSRGISFIPEIESQDLFGPLSPPNPVDPFISFVQVPSAPLDQPAFQPVRQGSQSSSKSSASPNALARAAPVIAVPLKEVSDTALVLEEMEEIMRFECADSNRAKTFRDDEQLGVTEESERSTERMPTSAPIPRRLLEQGMAHPTWERFCEEMNVVWARVQGNEPRGLEEMSETVAIWNGYLDPFDVFMVLLQVEGVELQDENPSAGASREYSLYLGPKGVMQMGVRVEDQHSGGLQYRVSRLALEQLGDQAEAHEYGTPEILRVVGRHTPVLGVPEGRQNPDGQDPWNHGHDGIER